MLSFYIVLQTRIDYYAQHLFFAHRWAHFVLHHAGAFLIAMGMSGPVLYAGMPGFPEAAGDGAPGAGACWMYCSIPPSRRPCSSGCSISG